MFTIRQILVQMRQGDTDRSIARAGLISRKKLGLLRQQTSQRGLLVPQRPLLGNSSTVSRVGISRRRLPTGCAWLVKRGWGCPASTGR
jgi:hypothetical protein